MPVGRKRISGQVCVKTLCSEFGFSVVRRKSSHIILRKETPEGSIGTVVPDHEELKLGTFKGILKLANIDEEDFWKRFR